MVGLEGRLVMVAPRSKAWAKAMGGPWGAAGVAVALLATPWAPAHLPWLLTFLAWGLVALVVALRLGLTRPQSRAWVVACFAGLLSLASQQPKALAALPPTPMIWVVCGLGLAGLLGLLPPWKAAPVAPFPRRLAQRLAWREAAGALDLPAHQAALVGLRPGFWGGAEALLDAGGAWPLFWVAAALGLGAPAWLFLVAACLELALILRDRCAEPGELAAALDAAARPAPSSGPWVAPWFDSPLTVELGAEAAAALAPRRAALAEALQAEGGLLGALGASLGEALRQGGTWPAWLRPVGDLPAEAFALRVRQAMVAEGELRAGGRLVRQDAGGLEGKLASNGEGLWLTGQAWAKARRRGLELLAPETVVAHALAQCLDEHLDDLQALGPLAAAGPSLALR